MSTEHEEHCPAHSVRKTTHKLVVNDSIGKGGDGGGSSSSKQTVG